MLDACVAVQMTHLYFLILVLMVKNEAAADPAGPFGTHSYMAHQCYYCDQIFDSKEKLYDHLEVHSKTGEKPKKN
jgi:hypothetical protein